MIGRLRGVRLDVLAPRNKFQAKRCKRGAFAGSMPNASFLTNAAPEFASRDCSWLFGPGECACPSRTGGGGGGEGRGEYGRKEIVGNEDGDGDDGLDDED